MNMPLALLNRRRRGAVAFSPTALFALAEPGVWYDPSDLTTLFQDSAGTTPVTTPGQTVALALDKSKGLVLGSELVTNGDFSSGTGWTVTPEVTISGGVATFTASASSSALFRSASVVVGRTYEITVVVTSVSSGTIRPRLFGGAATPLIISAAGTYTFKDVLTTSNFNVGFVTTGPFTGVVDNISVRELPGFHATQATTASRPIYGIHPVGGRRNLLTYTEDLTNAAWTKSNLTATATTITGAAGTSAKQVIQVQSASATGRTLSFRAQEGTARYIQILFNGDAAPWANIDLQTGIVGSVGSSQTVTVTADPLGGYRVALSTASSTATNVIVGLVDSNSAARGATTSVTGSVTLTNFQSEAGATATAYQRVTTQYDVTEAGVASVSYLAFDGVDDFLITPTITPGIDKAQVFAGVRHQNTAATGAFIETSTDAGSNAGSLAIYTNTTSYSWRTGGTTRVTASGNVTPPITSVLTGIGDISGDVARLRVNGSQVAETLTDQGSGNFLAYPFYIGRRGGTTLPFNGNIYSLIVRFGANLTADQITSTETWVNGKTRAY